MRALYNFYFLDRMGTLSLVGRVPASPLCYQRPPCPLPVSFLIAPCRPLWASHTTLVRTGQMGAGASQAQCGGVSSNYFWDPQVLSPGGDRELIFYSPGFYPVVKIQLEARLL